VGVRAGGSFLKEAAPRPPQRTLLWHNAAERHCAKCDVTKKPKPFVRARSQSFDGWNTAASGLAGAGLPGAGADSENTKKMEGASLILLPPLNVNYIRALILVGQASRLSIRSLFGWFSNPCRHRIRHPNYHLDHKILRFTNTVANSGPVTDCRFPNSASDRPTPSPRRTPDRGLSRTAIRDPGQAPGSKKH